MAYGIQNSHIGASALKDAPTPANLNGLLNAAIKRLSILRHNSGQTLQQLVGCKGEQSCSRPDQPEPAEPCTLDKVREIHEIIAGCENNFSEIASIVGG